MYLLGNSNFHYEPPVEWEEIQNHFEVVYEEWVNANQVME
jgi:hypothetical protein